MLLDVWRVQRKYFSTNLSNIHPEYNNERLPSNIYSGTYMHGNMIVHVVHIAAGSYMYIYMQSPPSQLISYNEKKNNDECDA